MSAVEEEARAMLPVVVWADEADTSEEGHVGIGGGGLSSWPALWAPLWAY